jgi:hypothetical protein
VAGGPPAARDAALAGLELIADSFLSVATPVQLAAADLLEHGVSVRAAIQARIGANLASLREAARSFTACEVLKTEGGWSAVIRVRPREARSSSCSICWSRRRFAPIPDTSSTSNARHSW